MMLSVFQKSKTKMATSNIASNGNKAETQSKSLESAQETKDRDTPSIYAVAAANSLSKDIKEKSLHLIKVRRRHGDWGQFDLTHAWSPEDFVSDPGSSRHGSAMIRDSSLVDNSLNMARIFCTEPVKVFQEYRVKPIIQQVLETYLADQKYDPEFCKRVTVQMCEEIKEQVKRLCYHRYKIVCHVMVGDFHQQDVNVVSRCAWNSAVDRFAEYEFRNYHLYAIGIVFGIYCE
ncbi:Dynein light chain Tctex-type 5-B [Acropora cervicornis]|uniref:Dynein light chain Tctex-type 5-B n=1 Tax=Acropora cervicornis TaxID=6130 RepID=A0AAD9R0M4_ACRCE|nr:Dynein light chain Tctex-type 5-B [Acropora cervicornis]